MMISTSWYTSFSRTTNRPMNKLAPFPSKTTSPPVPCWMATSSAWRSWESGRSERNLPSLTRQVVKMVVDNIIYCMYVVCINAHQPNSFRYEKGETSRRKAASNLDRSELQVRSSADWGRWRPCRCESYENFHFCSLCHECAVNVCVDMTVLFILKYYYAIMTS